MNAYFYVYMHARPDGRVFYVGKGSKRRAYDMSTSRRSAHHINIIRKYGRDNIKVRLIPCMTEQEAFALERVHIALRKGELINRTDGGEGCSGRKVSEKQAVGLSKGRMKGKNLSAEARAAFRENMKKASSWIRTEEGKQHIKMLGEAGKERLHKERELLCIECKKSFITRSAKAKCCSRRCEQRNRRARERAIS